VEAVAFHDVRTVLGGAMVRIGDVMTREVETIDPSATLEDAASRMKTLDVGLLPVCDGDRMVGMITDRDITVRATAGGLVPGMTLVREAMTPDAIYCEIGDDVRRAAGLMEAHQVRRLPVLDGDRRLVGIVSLGDIAVRAGNDELSGEVLEGVSEPSEGQRLAA
jgi:CBS domain-containing protein